MSEQELQELKAIASQSPSAIAARKMEIYKYLKGFATMAQNKDYTSDVFDIVYSFSYVPDLKSMFLPYLTMLAMKNPEVMRTKIGKIFQLAKLDDSALNCFTMLGDLGDFPIEEHLEDIFAVCFDPSKTSGLSLLSTLLPKLAKKYPDRFRPHLKEIRDLVPNFATGSGALMILGELADVHPEWIATPTLFSEMEHALAVAPTFYYYIFQVIAKSGRASIEASQDALAWLAKRYQIESGQAQMSVLTSIREASSENRAGLATHISWLEAVTKDHTIPPNNQTVAQQIVDFYYERSLEKVDKKIEAMGEIWQKLGLQADDPLVKAVTDTVDVKAFDVMISYNWNHKDKVLRIRDCLVEYGVTCWMDVDQMSGNIYGKMAEAVLGCKVIVPCMTGAYEASLNCKRELGYAADKRRKIVPIRLENIDFTWSGLITAGAIYTIMTDKEFNDPALFEGCIKGVVGELSAALGRPLTKGSKAEQIHLKSEGATAAATSTPAPPAAAAAAPVTKTVPKQVPTSSPAPVTAAPTPAKAPTPTVSSSGASAAEVAELRQTVTDLQKRVEELERLVQNLLAGSAPAATTTTTATAANAAGATSPPAVKSKFGFRR